MTCLPGEALANAVPKKYGSNFRFLQFCYIMSQKGYIGKSYFHWDAFSTKTPIFCFCR